MPTLCSEGEIYRARLRDTWRSFIPCSSARRGGHARAYPLSFAVCVHLLAVPAISAARSSTRTVSLGMGRACAETGLAVKRAAEYFSLTTTGEC